MGNILLEQETVIEFNDGEEVARVWSASPGFQRRMGKLGIEAKRRAERERGKESCWYEIPKRWVKIRMPVVMSAEDRAKRAASARARFSVKNKREV